MTRQVQPVVLVHGGAGPMKKLGGNEEAKYRSGLLASSKAGLAALAKSGDAVAAVVAAILSMEDSGDFNAGAGSCLDEEGAATLDAALMRGSDLAAGAVGCATATKNPILACKSLLDEGRHVLLVGPGADRRAKALGLAPLPPIDAARVKIHANLLAELRATGKEPAARLASTSRFDSGRLKGVTEAESHDTVGAVAVDAQGRLAAAVSTGGLWLKTPGRVGDSVVLGGGLYASDRLGGAAVATGIGEKIMRVCLCKEAVDRIGQGATAQQAAEGAIATVTKEFGADTAGVIVLDRHGNVGAAFDTRGMGRSWARGGETATAVWATEKF